MTMTQQMFLFSPQENHLQNSLFRLRCKHFCDPYFFPFFSFIPSPHLTPQDFIAFSQKYLLCESIHKKRGQKWQSSDWLHFVPSHTQFSFQIAQEKPQTSPKCNISCQKADTLNTRKKLTSIVKKNTKYESLHLHDTFQNCYTQHKLQCLMLSGIIVLESSSLSTQHCY